MTDHRTERISEALREELAELIGYELNDPRVGSATVTDVQVTPDKRHAIVHIGVAAESDKQQTLEGLEHARSFLRRELATRLDVYRIPELHFEADVTAEGPRLEHLLKRVRKGRPRE